MQQRPDFPLEKSDLCLQSEAERIFRLFFYFRTGGKSDVFSGQNEGHTL